MKNKYKILKHKQVKLRFKKIKMFNKFKVIKIK